MPPKRKYCWAKYKRNERAAFEKKHGMSECQEALEVWEDKAATQPSAPTFALQRGRATAQLEKDEAWEPRAQ